MFRALTSQVAGRYHFGFTNCSSSTGHQLSGGHGPEIWHTGALMYLPARPAQQRIILVAIQWWSPPKKTKFSECLRNSVRTAAKCVELKERDVLHARILACCQALIEAACLVDARPAWAVTRLVSPRTVEGAEADYQLGRWDSAANMRRHQRHAHAVNIRQQYEYVFFACNDTADQYWYLR